MTMPVATVESCRHFRGGSNLDTEPDCATERFTEGRATMDAGHDNFVNGTIRSTKAAACTRSSSTQKVSFQAYKF